MPVFECRLKEDRAGMRKGTTIRVSTPLNIATQTKLQTSASVSLEKKQGTLSSLVIGKLKNSDFVWGQTIPHGLPLHL